MTNDKPLSSLRSGVPHDEALTEQDFIHLNVVLDGEKVPQGDVCFKERVQSAKRLLKQKIIELDKQNAQDSLTYIDNPNYDNGFHDACLLFRAELIDACFQIDDGKSKGDDRK
jgi:hypothetical protein